MQRVEIFIAIVETGSFTKAALKLGMTKAVVSFNIKQLEKELNISLLVRNTRKISITEIGQIFYKRFQPLVKETQQILNDIRSDHNGLTGSLRITTTSEYGTKKIIPILAKFSKKNPELRIQHVSSSKNDDLILEQFDIAIRLGKLEDSNYQARLIDQFEILPVASPDFLKNQNYTVNSLSQIKNMNWIANSRIKNSWKWEIKDSKENAYILNNLKYFNIKTDNISSLLELALNGDGIALLPLWFIEKELLKGSLVNLLPNYKFPKQGVYAIYPETKYLPEKTRKFIDFLLENIAI